MFPPLRKRFYGSARVRNLLKNSTAQGAVAGTPGTLPTNWALWAPDVTNGISTQVVGTGWEDGIEYVDWRVNGTPAAGSSASVRATTSLSYATRTNSVLNKPTGTTTNDIVVCLMNIQGSHTTAPSVTPPSGFSEQTSPGNFTDTGSNQAVWHVYTKLAGGSEPSTYTFTHSSAATECVMLSIQGADTAISVVVGAIHQTNGTTTINYDSITTSRANSVVIAWGVAWDDATGGTAASGTTPTFSSNFTGISTEVSSGAWSSSGATGAKTSTVTNSNTYTFGVLVAIQASASPAAGDSGIYFSPLNATTLPCGNGQGFCLSAFVKLVSGALPFGLFMQHNYVDGGFSYVGGNSLNIVPSSSLSLRNQRFIYPAICNQSSSAFCQPNLTFDYNATFDVTIRVGLPQFERGLIASTPERKATI